MRYPPIYLISGLSDLNQSQLSVLMDLKTYPKMKREEKEMKLPNLPLFL